MDFDEKSKRFREKMLGKGFNEAKINSFIKKKRDAPVDSDNVGTFANVDNEASAQFASIPRTGKVLPANAPISQQFGNYNPALYRGINKSLRNTGTDFSMPVGSKISLPSGKWKAVEVSGNGSFNRGFGNSILVENKKTGEQLRFSHLSKVAPIKKGQIVDGDRVIALSGNTGNTTGPHLDLEFYDEEGNLRNVLASRYARSL